MKPQSHRLPVREAQLLTYMQLLKKKLGVLINFNSAVLKEDGIIRRALRRAPHDAAQRRVHRGTSKNANRGSLGFAFFRRSSVAHPIGSAGRSCGARSERSSGPFALVSSPCLCVSVVI